MKKNIEDYLVVFNNALSGEVCDNAIKELETQSWEQHTYYDSGTDSHSPVNGEQELDISHSNIELTDTIMSAVGQCLSMYMSVFNFPWFGGLSGYTGIRFNRYRETALMSEHCDHIYSMFDGERKGIPVLSILGILNDDYSGGELIFWQDTKIETQKGDIIVWPSLFLYPHKVEPVTQGNRYSFVSWAW